MSKKILVTGITGFMGKEFAKDIVASNQNDSDHDKIYALVRKPEEAKAKLAPILKEQQDQVEYLQADIMWPDCRLTKAQIDSLGEIDEFWHLAADTRFEETREDEIKATNIRGTKNVLDLSDKLKGVKHFVYISTAYIAGKSEGIIPEGKFHHSNGFKNPYEQSKHDCELNVREQCKHPLTVVRPSILIGDSATGDPMGERRMFYGYALTLLAPIFEFFGGISGDRGKKNFLSYWESTHENDVFQDVHTRLVGSPETTKNIVPIDYAIKVLRGIRQDIQPKTFNLVNSRNVTMGAATDAIQKALKIRGFWHDPSFVPELSTTEDEAANLEEIAARSTRVYHPYLVHSEPRWEYGNVSSLGVKEATMTDDLFSKLMDTFVQKTIIGGLRRRYGNS